MIDALALVRSFGPDVLDGFRRRLALAARGGDRRGPQGSWPINPGGAWTVSLPR